MQCSPHEGECGETLARSVSAICTRIPERVETTFSQLWGRFVDRVFSRSWAGLWTTVKLKLLHYNLAHARILTV
jgi:hypothetical protein